MLNRVEKPSKTKRSYLGAPVSLYVEAVIVVDYSSYALQKRNINSTNQAFTFSFMKIYYSHMISLVRENTCLYLVL